MFEKKYKIIMLRKEYGTINIIHILKTNEISNTVKYRGKTFTLNIDKPIYTDNKQKVYFVDFDVGSQLKIEGIESKLNPDELDLFLSSNLIKQLSSSALMDKKERIINMLIGFVVGALLSALLMFFYMQNQINEMLANLNVGVVIP